LTNDEARCAEHEQFSKIDAAFHAGDLAGLRAALGDPEDFPNSVGPLTIGYCLPYAIYHSPIGFIRELLDAGADPNIEVDNGFPPMLAAVSCLTTVPGAVRRPDVHEVLELLLQRGADPHQRGVNDYTALHWAAAEGDRRAVEILLRHGADPSIRTRIDDLETPAMAARRGGHSELAALLEG